MAQEEFKQDLETLEKETSELQIQLANVNNQRVTLTTRIQQLSGAAAYLRGKLNIKEPEEVVEEKPDETTEENSEG